MSDEQDGKGDREQAPPTRISLNPLDGDDFFFAPADDEQQTGGDDALLETDDRQAQEIREIFGTAFPQYLQPVEEILEQVLAGKADEESFQALLGMLASLQAASQRMGFDQIYDLLKRLNDHVDELDRTAEGAVSREQREAVISDLLEIKDKADEMAGDSRIAGTEKQKTIFSVLKGREGIGDLVLRRLSAAGIITVDQLGMGRPDEIAAVSGLDIDIVNNVLGVLREEGHLKRPSRPPRASGAPRTSKAPRAAKGAGEAAHVSAAPAEAEGRAEMPIDLKNLHEQVLEQLKLEVESEASVEEVRAQIRKLRAAVLERRRALSSLENSAIEKKRSLSVLQDRLADRSTAAEELRARRDSLAREAAAAKEKVRQKEVRLELLLKEKRSLSAQTSDLNREVSGLVDSVGQLRRSVARKRVGGE